MTSNITIFWFRQDLRLSDNPGLYAAAKNGPVMPIYILDDLSPGIFKIGRASKLWLHHSLTSLNQSLRNNLNVYVGHSREILLKLIDQHNIVSVYWNRCYEPWRANNDAQIKAELKAINIECKSFNGSLLWEPWEIQKKDNSPYKVYTPFYNNGCLQALPPREPLPEPEKLTLVKDQYNPIIIETLQLLPNINWHKPIEQYWNIGEKSAQLQLRQFLSKAISGYKDNRNYPFKPNVSRLSPYLHFGEISPNQAWYQAQIKETNMPLSEDLDHFLRELGWREFSYYLIYNFPDLPSKNFQPKFNQFPWENNSKLLKAWQKGVTGYPMVDAGMRELWQTGYMHNRLRMTVGSFLVKNLLVNWQHGEAWFWDCLLDADLASNSFNWQWVAGSGADAAPYFRIFNPITQGEKFDPNGLYTRYFVPELAKLPNQYLFQPWKAPEHILKAAGVILGQNYPMPIVNLEDSRAKAMNAYYSISSGSAI